MAGKRKFSDDEFDDIDLTEEEIEYLNISIDGSDNEHEKENDVIHEKMDLHLPKTQKKYKKIIASIIAIVICISVVVAIIIVKNKPNPKWVNLYNFFKVTEGSSEVAISINHELKEDKGYFIEDKIYIPNDLVAEYFTDKLYEDVENRVILYTTESEINEIPYGENYMVSGSAKNEYEYAPIRDIEGKVYVCADFIKELSGCDFYTYREPARIAFETGGSEYMRVKSIKANAVRVSASIKSKIIGELSEDSRWYELDDKSGDWQKVVSDDGRIGYIKTQKIDSIVQEKVAEPVVIPYKNQLRDHNIVLVWDGIYVVEENEGIEQRLENVTNVNVISPTWYRVKGTDGEIECLMDEDYLQFVRDKGMEVWPLISDFNAGAENGFDEKALLSKTEYRRNLIENIVNEINKYHYDGINIDFEKIKKEYGKDYVQFLRELSIECRKSEVVLSVDNYVPFSFNEFYGRAAQSECVDYVIVMCYDEHYDGGPSSGSTASISYVVDGTRKTLEVVDKDKLIVGVPFYSRLWQSEIDQIENKKNILSTKAYSMNGGETISKELGLTSVWDDTVKQTVASGYANGYFYEIWLETLESMNEKINAIKEFDVAGVAAWSLGSEDSGVWNIFEKITPN